MAWTIEYSDTARKELRKMERQVAERILDYMDKRVALSSDPRSYGKPLTGPLGSFWSYRVGDMRVICSLEDDVLRVLVVGIGDRKDVYRKAKR
ncbi:type II toxin-antitoxin system RelE family toxin [Parvibaculum sp.]|uniref:type II toxin-antitoxin system RelE family toxin n=1 Tax=Parvibaculum sp. TaxID=2024848 RepID=UPI003BAA5767